MREDYSADGNAWDYFPFDQAHRRVYRWNEDGLLGFCDRRQHLCLSLGLWNGCDPILKERLFGLSGPEGNHGEDVKEVYYYLDNIPTHSYLKGLYRYPQARFPYELLRRENAQRTKLESEFEIIDTGIFAENRFFDVFIEFAKADQDDILMKVTAVNRGPERAGCELLPQLWFRNTWSWGYPAGPKGEVPVKPQLKLARRAEGHVVVAAQHAAAGHYTCYVEGRPEVLFTENESNNRLLFGSPNESPFVKDAFHRYVVAGEQDAVNPKGVGTKMAARYRLELAPGAAESVRLRLAKVGVANPFREFDALMHRRRADADAFYAAVQAPGLNAEQREVQRQALAGMLWNKQFYYYDLPQWLAGDPAQPPPPAERLKGRNHDWRHLTNFDVLSMPDSWEYPWYAVWDTAFHCLPLSLVDFDYARRQLELMTREWYMHPNGQLPAYEWTFSDVNPPVHAWAVWHLYEAAEREGRNERSFLEGMFQKLLLNFTWWVNRKDTDGNNIFQGGFLGLDNIGPIDRSAALPDGGHIEQADGTAWMAAFCLTMVRIALELAEEEPIYQDSASKFLEHFLRIAHAMTQEGPTQRGLWDEEDGFFYDALHIPGSSFSPLKIRSMVGLIPLFAVTVFEPDTLEQMPTFSKRLRWFTGNRPWLSSAIVACEEPGEGKRRLLSLLSRERLIRVLKVMLDENEFLSPYGLRSLSKYHAGQPFQLRLDGQVYTVNYEPAESETGLFGGNSNWRGPVWFPLNYLLIEALRRYHSYYGDGLQVECPTGSGRWMNLAAVADTLASRLIDLFMPTAGRRPVFGRDPRFQDAAWRDYLLFYEYFHGDDGHGLGAAHQTGWTGLVANLLQEKAE